VPFGFRPEKRGGGTASVVLGRSQQNSAVRAKRVNGKKKAAQRPACRALLPAPDGAGTTVGGA